MVLFVKRKIRSAIENDDVPALEKLFQLAGVSPEMEVKGDGWTPLYFAARCGSLKAVNWLIDKGADVEAKSGMGWTPLHTAAYHGRRDAVAALLKAGADSHSINNEGQNPLWKARSGDRRDIVELLERHDKEQAAPKGDARLSPKIAEPARAGAWTLLSPTDIARIVADEGVGYKLTDIFNFGARERIRIVCNLQTRTDTIETRAFADLQDKTQLEEAFRALKAAGGNADGACLDPLGKPAVTKPEAKTGL